MEYIDKAKAVENIKKLMSSIPATDNYAKGYDASLGRVLIAVRGVSPVTDVQPVKRGKWLSRCEGDIYDFTECSECGNMESCETPYCAQCGARMDGDSE